MNSIRLISHFLSPQAPFESGTINDPELDKISVPRRNPYITSIKFSNNGKYLLVGTSGVFHYVMDSYDLSVLARLEGHEGLEKDKRGNMSIKSGKGLSGAEVCWTPDSCFVMSGKRHLAPGPVYSFRCRRSSNRLPRITLFQDHGTAGSACGI